jgi:hypothetical protein
MQRRLLERVFTEVTSSVVRASNLREAVQDSVGNFVVGVFCMLSGCAVFAASIFQALTSDRTTLVQTLYGINVGSLGVIFLSFGGMLLSVQFSATALVQWFGWALVVSGCTLALGLAAYAFARLLEASRR